MSAVYPWKDIAEAARLVARSRYPWVLVGHTVHRTHGGQIKVGNVPAFLEGKRVPYETVTRSYGETGSLWVRYVGRRKT